jgi:hypothetical protein
MSKQGTKALLLAGAALMSLALTGPAKSGILDPAPRLSGQIGQSAAGL